MPGFSTPPHGYIETLRDLLSGYGTADAVIKELVQNSEDAKANNLQFAFMEGDKKAGKLHRLLTSPALCVINNGPFRKEDHEAIFRIGLGTRASDSNTIGRFGKGLKSVFSFSESFFLAAKTDWEGGGDFIDFLNPYKDWLYKSWDSEYEANAEEIRSYLGTRIEAMGWHSKWLGFWIPLRQESQLNNNGNTICELYHWGRNGSPMPGDSDDFKNEMTAAFNKLQPRLSLMRNLQSISMRSELDEAPLLNTHIEHHKELPSSPNLEIHRREIKGKVNGKEHYPFTGLVGRLTSQRFESLHSEPDWPQVIDYSGQSISRPVKGEPHFSALFIENPDAPKTLTVTTSVFLPVGRQPFKKTPKLPEFEHGIEIILHGFFFLDSERLRIDGFDYNGFDQSISERKNDSKSTTTLEWNKHLAEEGALGHLLQAMDIFLRGRPQSQAANLTSAIRHTELWQQYSSAITQHFTYIYKLTETGNQWELAPADRPILRLPNPEEDQPADFILNLFPSVKNHFLHASVIIGDTEECGLYGDNSYREWKIQELTNLFHTAKVNNRNRNYLKRWILSLPDLTHIEGTILQSIAHIPLIKICPVDHAEDSRWATIQECVELADSRKLFRGSHSTNLCEALRTLDAWFYEDDVFLPQHLNISVELLDTPECLADLILKSPKLGAPTVCWDLATTLLASSNEMTSSDVKCAARYLLHRAYEHRHDIQTRLWLNTTGNSHYQKLLKTLLPRDVGIQTWQLLDSNIVTSSFPQNHFPSLYVQRIDTSGVLMELRRYTGELNTIDFKEAEWTQEERETLIESLCRSQNIEDIKMVRQLSIHSLVGNKGWISLANSDGELTQGYLLEATEDSGPQISPQLEAIWSEFLNESYIVKRCRLATAAAAQRNLFKFTDEERQLHVAELTWREIISRCLDLESPERFLKLILSGLELQGGAAIAGLGAKLKNSPLVKLGDGQIVSLANILLMDQFDSELTGLFAETPDAITRDQLPDWLLKHSGFIKNRQSILPQKIEILRKVEHLFAQDSKWWIGLPSLPENLHAFLSATSSCDALPACQIIDQLLRISNNPTDVNNLFSQISRLLPTNQDSQERLLQILKHLQSSGEIELHHSYLKQIVDQGWIESLLPEIMLRNEHDEWVKTSQLIRPATGPDPKWIIHNAEANILGFYENETTDQLTALEAEGAISNEQNSDPTLLIEYLENFSQHPSYDPRMAAAFIAVCYDNTELLAYAEKKLNGQSLEIFRENLIKTETSFYSKIRERFKEGKFVFKLIQGTLISAESLTGETISVPLSQDPDSLLGNSDNLRKRKRTSDGTLIVKELELRHVENPSDITNLRQKWKQTLKAIIQNAYQVLPTFCPHFASLDKILGQDNTLRRTQQAMLEKAEEHLKQLRSSLSDELIQIQKRFDEALQMELDAREKIDLQDQEGAQVLRNCSARLKEECRNTLLSHISLDSVQAPELSLIKGTRQRLKDWRYSEQSVLFELFQNADDATSELLKLQPESSDGTFYINWNDANRSLLIRHEGRPINHPLSLNTSTDLARSYRRDLERMLTHNFSEKTASSTDVTGRFGLGFKSIFFLAERPQIISGELACEIRGSLYPLRLEANIEQNIRSRMIDSNSNRSQTCFALTISQHLDKHKINELIETFSERAPYLAACSHSIRNIRVQSSSHPTLHLERDDINHDNACSRIKISPDRKLLIVHRNADRNKPASWLFDFNSTGFKKRRESIPPIWITAPTCETSQVPCAINGKFLPDAGRMRLATEAIENKTEADAIADDLRIAISDWVDEIQSDDSWNTFLFTNGMDNVTSLYMFWSTFSKIVKDDAFLVKEWADVRDNGSDFIGYMLWNVKTGAMRQSAKTHAIIPSGLQGDYQTLSQLGQIQFYLDGSIAQHLDLFNSLSLWTTIRNTFLPGTIVDEATGKFISKLRAQDNQALPQPIHLKDLLQCIATSESVITTDLANQLGLVLNRSFFDTIKKDYGRETAALSWFLESLQFPTSSNTHAPASRLIVLENAGSKEIDSDERRRAAFAPKESRLASGFTGDGIRFFALCRPKLEADKNRLAEWAQPAQGKQLKAVFDYFYNGNSQGEIAKNLAIELGEPWILSAQKTLEFAKLDELSRKKIWALFEQGSYKEQEAIIGEFTENEHTLETLLDQWKKHQDTCDYTTTGAWWSLICPTNFKVDIRSNESTKKMQLRAWLENPTSEDGKQVWFRFLAIAGLLSGGRRTNELLNFIQSNKPFQQVWHASNQTELDNALSGAFNELIGTPKDSIYSKGEYAYIWRRVFYDLRKIFHIVHEFGFGESILELCQKSATPREILEFMRAGIVSGDPQPWVGVSGQTASSTLLFLLRELRRIGLLNEAYEAHCYFMCRPVRRAAVHFGILDESAINETDLFKLMDLSKELHEKIQATPDLADGLKGTYDIPFLAYGLNAL